MRALGRHSSLIARFGSQQREPQIGQPITRPVKTRCGSQAGRHLAASRETLVEPDWQFTQQRLGFSQQTAMGIHELVARTNEDSQLLALRIGLTAGDSLECMG
jgi:hypothetical protein